MRGIGRLHSPQCAAPPAQLNESLMATPKTKNTDTAANLGFEARLWAVADALRNNMGAATSTSSSD